MGFITNVDTLIYSVDVKNYNFSSNRILEKLEEKKVLSKANTDSVLEKIEFHIDNDNLGLTTSSPFEDVMYSFAKENGEYKGFQEIHTFEVYPHGSRHHNYILHNDFFEIKIAGFRSTNEDNYPIYIKFKSKLLWSTGLRGGLNIIEKIISKYFGEVLTTKITRADMCCHTDEFTFHQRDIDRFCGKFRNDIIYRQDREVTAFNFGSMKTKNLFARIYNKTLEVEIKKNKQWFVYIWIEKNLDPTKVWNCEFELKRGFFKEYGIETMDDFINKQNDIWLYLTGSWLQFKNLTNERLTRCDTNDNWLLLSMLKFNENEYKGIKRIIQHMTEAENMIPQIAGCITSFAAKKGMIDYDESIENVLKSIHDYLLYCKGTTYEELVYSKL